MVEEDRTQTRIDGLLGVLRDTEADFRRSYARVLDVVAELEEEKAGAAAGFGTTARLLAGVGNVYRAELLFRHQLDPLQPGCELHADQWAALWSDLVGLMRDGVRRGRIDTVRPEQDPVRMGHAPRQDRHGGEVYVYRRAGAPCLVCATTVATTTHAGRKLYWCPTCQQRPVR